MSALAVLGMVVAVLIDLVAPLVLCALLITRNRRHRRSATTDQTFWIVAVAYLVILVLLAASAVRDVLAFHGAGVVLVTVFAIPLGAVPAVFNSTLIHLFFTDAEWAAGGYQVVLTAYVTGMVAWAFLNLAGLRALTSRGRARAARFVPIGADSPAS